MSDELNQMQCEACRAGAPQVSDDELPELMLFEFQRRVIIINDVISLGIKQSTSPQRFLIILGNRRVKTSRISYTCGAFEAMLFSLPHSHLALPVS